MIPSLGKTDFQAVCGDDRSHQETHSIFALLGVRTSNVRENSRN